MLLFADIFFTIIHLAIILFNLFGWIPRSTRRAHLVMVTLTAASWFVLGIWFGMGYCPITDWQWKVKELRGEMNLPGNFVEYFAEKLSNYNFNSRLVNIVTGVCFALAAGASLYVNFSRKENKT
jgi:hypothetical protein